VDSKQLLRSLNNREYDIDEEDANLAKLSLLIAMGDTERVC